MRRRRIERTNGDRSRWDGCRGISLRPVDLSPDYLSHGAGLASVAISIRWRSATLRRLSPFVHHNRKAPALISAANTLAQTARETSPMRPAPPRALAAPCYVAPVPLEGAQIVCFQTR